MGNTLVDEPLPPTQSEPPAGDRPTLDDPVAASRLTVDDVPQGLRRGPSPTLVDPPAPKRASPTLPDSPPPTPPAAPLFAVPAAPPPGAPTPPAATPPQPPVQSAAPVAVRPIDLPQPVAPAPQGALPGQPVLAPASAQQPAAAPPSAGGAPPKEFATTQKSADPPQAPVQAPPPLAYPVPAAPPGGLLAQLPAMPAARPGSAPFAAPAPVSASPPTPAREALPPPAAPPPAEAPVPAAAPAPAPMRLAPGARTLVGVAPGLGDGAPGHRAAPSAQSPDAPPAAIVQEGSGKFLPPGQTTAPSPHDPTLPVTSAVEPPPRAASPGEGAPPGPVAGPAEQQASGEAAGGVAAAPRPRSRARTVFAILFAVIGVLAIAGVTIGYFAFFRYAPLADRHIPGASNLVIRADVRAIGTFAPVRKHLWPVLFERPSLKVQGKTLADRVGDATGIRPSIDAREVIVASVDSRSWVALVGGNFEPGAFVPGLEKVLRDEGLAGWQVNGDLLVGPGGIAVAQADDGTLIFGTEAEIVTSALPASEEHRRVDLPKEAALAFAVSKEAWEELSRTTAAFDPGGALRRIRHVRGSLSLGDEPAVDLGIEPKDGEAADALGKDVEQLLSLARLGLVAVPDQMGEKTALSSAKVTVEAGLVRVRGPWPLEGLDRGCEKLASKIAGK